jgi:protoporphyrinogen oxidase
MALGIIGGGPAGITAAYQLAKAGKSVDVFEAGSSAGGLAKTIEIWGQRVDIGPHRFFSTDRRVNQLWLEIVGSDYRMVDRLTRIAYRNRLFAYPLEPFDALSKLGPLRTAYCIASFLRQKIMPIPHDGTFESWVIRRFGRELFEIFFKSYSEKLWGISCRELDADFAAQRIKKFSLWEALRGAFRLPGGVVHKTLVDRFAYPTGGTGMVYDRMADAVEKRGGQVHYNAPIRRVLIDESRAVGIELINGDKRSFDHVVSTMPLTTLVEGLDRAPDDVKVAAKSLRFRNTILVYLHIDGESIFPDNWLYIHSPEVRTGRITNFRNWVPELFGDHKTTILAMEYWCYDDDELWGYDSAAIVSLASDELHRTGLIRDAKILDTMVYPIKRSYPVYDRGYKQWLKRIEDYLSGIDRLSVIGRYGAFKYNNQDHSILMGILAAQNILSGYSQHNLWEVNTDYEAYQETSRITDLGLQITTT